MDLSSYAQFVNSPGIAVYSLYRKGSEEIASEAISAGVTDYLQKRGSEQYDRLATRIGHAVAQYRTEHELRERVKELTAIQTISDLLTDSDGLLGRATPASRYVPFTVSPVHRSGSCFALYR